MSNKVFYILTNRTSQLMHNKVFYILPNRTLQYTHFCPIQITDDCHPDKHLNHKTGQMKVPNTSQSKHQSSTRVIKINVSIIICEIIKYIICIHKEYYNLVCF